MKKFHIALLSISISFISSHLMANDKYCHHIEMKISQLDKHADNYYSFANYQFDDQPLLNDLRNLSRQLNDTSLNRTLSDAETAIENNDDELMMKIAPLSRYLNDWNAQHCS